MAFSIRASLLVLLVGASVVALSGQQARDLPRVLLIGDSISGGYKNFVVEELDGEAEVVRIPGNGRHTGIGLEKLDEWLGDKPWDVIHFNWGLHDLAYRRPGVNLDKKNGTVSTSLEDYEKNLKTLVQRLKKTGARLVWASTTPVPPGEPGRFVGDSVKYNHVAKQIMKENKVMVNDLHAAVMKLGPEAYSGPGNVHFKKEASKALGVQVAKSIRTALAKRSLSTRLGPKVRQIVPTSALGMKREGK